MLKNLFEFWNILKQKVEIKTFAPFFHEREIWWIYLGKNIGFEQDGKGQQFVRPVLIVLKFNNSFFWGIPLSTQKKIGKYYFSFNLFGKKEQTAILSQMRPFSVKRLQTKIGKISRQDFKDLKSKMKGLF